MSGLSPQNRKPSDMRLRVFPIASALLALLCIDGCITTTTKPFPGTLPARLVNSPDACPKGEYENRGITNSDGSPFLSDWFHFGAIGLDAESISSVSVACEGDSLDVVAKCGGQIVGRQKLRRINGEWFLGHDRIELPAKRSATGDWGATLRTETFALATAKDASLLGTIRDMEIGAFFWVFPIAGDRTFQFQWKPVEK